MNIQDLVREKVIGNIKTGTKNEKGLPQKLSYFNVEEDKATSFETVEAFKKLYKENPKKIIIRFTKNNPFYISYRRYVKGKAMCIGNGVKAITVAKDDKNRNSQIEVDCSENCEHRQTGKCKLKGNLRFVVDGIEAGGVWNLNTSGGASLSNIATQIVKYMKKGESIVGEPFELSLNEMESLAYGNYYSVDLKKVGEKPTVMLDGNQIESNIQEPLQIDAPKEKVENKKQDISKLEEKSNVEDNKFEDYLVIKEFSESEINGKKFKSIVFQDSNGKDIEYVLHPRAEQVILTLNPGSVIQKKEVGIEQGKNVLCKYIIEEKFEEIKKAV